MDLFRAASPDRPIRREWFMPAVIGGSILLHAVLVASLVWSPRARAARPPAEIPIEVVQLPPAPTTEKKPEPKLQTSTPEAAKKAAKAQPPSKGEKTQTPEKPSASSVADRMRQLLGPMQALAMPSLGTGDNPLDDPVPYRQLVLSRLAKQKREGRHEGIPGHAVVSFEIGEGGEVLRCEVREKSGDPQLDAEAVAMVQRGAPYPAPPPGAERRFSFGLRFQAL